MTSTLFLLLSFEMQTSSSLVLYFQYYGCLGGLFLSVAGQGMFSLYNSEKCNCAGGSNYDDSCDLQGSDGRGG